MLTRLKSIAKRLLKAVVKTVFANESNPASQIDNNLRENSIIDTCEISPSAAIKKNCYLYKSKIGDFTYLSSNVNVMNTNIGKFCSIAYGVCISTGIHPSSTFVSSHPSFYSLNKQNGITFAQTSHFREMGETIIGNDVWIGLNAIIMDDIVVGDGAIIGAGSIVTKNVPPYAIVVGNPAKILRYRFNENEIDFLLKFKWWDRDVEWIKNNYKVFHDIKSFIAKFS